MRQNATRNIDLPQRLKREHERQNGNEPRWRSFLQYRHAAALNIGKLFSINRSFLNFTERALYSVDTRIF